jgi:hypothetical protein
MKNRLVLYASLIMAAISFAAPCYASYLFRPYPHDLSDLPHEKYFTWGINIVLPPDEKIVDATLQFTNIWDWSTEKTDHLFIHMLDNPKSGVLSYTDNQGGGDNFAGKGIFIGNWTDPVGSQPRNYDLVYDFRDMGLLDNLKSYLATVPKSNQATFGFGIDPDCHFFNDDVTFTIFTEPINANSVPEPLAILLLLFGVAMMRANNLPHSHSARRF